MGLYKAEAIVLRGRDYGEADRLLTLYSREHGKIPALAKGVRKPRSRLRGGVQPFTHSLFVLYQGRALDTVTQSDARETFPGLASDLTLFASASYLAELVDVLTPERQGNEQVFLWLLAAFHLLGREDPELVCRLAELRLLAALGYRPELYRCVSCGAQDLEGAFFGPGAGGVLCPACRALDGEAVAVRAGTLKLMQRLAQADPRLLGRLRASGENRREMAAALAAFIHHRSERPLRSASFLRQVGREAHKGGGRGENSRG